MLIMSEQNPFPENFIWGTATASHQVEGACNNNNWYFLRGDIVDIIELSENGFFLSASLLPGGHSTRFVLVDQKKQIRKFYEGTVDANVMELQNDIVTLINQS